MGGRASIGTSWTSAMSKSFFSIAEELVWDVRWGEAPSTISFCDSSKVWRGRWPGGVVAPLLRGKGPRRSYCRGGRLFCCSTAQQFGRFVTLALKTGEHFVCGAALFPAEHPLLERVVGETTDCAADVSPHLFSCNLAFPNCCYCCGSTEDLVDEEELRGRYQRIHQVCSACKERGRVARTHGPVQGVAPAAKRIKKWSPAAQGRTSALFVVSCTCVEFEQVKFEFCESCRDWASNRLFIALRLCLESGSAVFTRQSTELSTNRVLCSSMDIQCGDYHLCGLYLHSLSECKKGIRWSINGTGIMGMGLGAFLFFLNTFVFFSLARFGFSKKSDEKQRSNKVHPYAAKMSFCTVVDSTKKKGPIGFVTPIFMTWLVDLQTKHSNLLMINAPKVKACHHLGPINLFQED